MLLNVQIQDHSFKLSIGSGLNDWSWLSHYAAKKFSKISYPQGAYLPSQLYILDKQNQKIYPHPRQKINTFLEQNKLNVNHITTVVKIRKGNQVFTENQKMWQSQAFGLQRMMMNVIYVLESEKYKNKEGQKEFYFKLLLHYNMHNDIRHFFNEKYTSPIQIELQQNKIDSKLTSFKGHVKLPYGDISPQLYFYSRDPKDPTNYRSQKIKDIELKPDVFRVNLIISPKYRSIQQQNQAAAQQMKISQNITKSLQQKQLQAKKRNANSSLCCYGFQQFWKLLQQQHAEELLLQQYDKSTRQRLKIILQKSLNSLYQIFFYYFIIENQNKDKKEQLGVTYQHVMHFLIFYGIFDNIKSLNEFLQYYNSDSKFKNIKDTVDIENKSVKFVQFVAILLRSLQFLQTSTFQIKQQTFDSLVASHIDTLIKIDGQQQQFCQFKRNIRQNPKIISFFRNVSPNLKQIFINHVIRSTQKASDKYVMMKQQFKSLLESSGLTNKNTDTIVQDLFEELNLSEEGVFYYGFAEAIQWLALALVSSDKDNNYIQNQQEQAVLIIQKMKFFIEKIQ